VTVEKNALRVERIYVRGFRNLEDLDLSPGPGFNVLHGDNGAGKSNLLEAIYYLGALRSFRGAKAEDLIGLGKVESILKAKVASEGVSRVLQVALSRDKPRRAAMDGKRPRSMAAWHGAVPMVLFFPGQIELTAGGAQGRRVFLDRILEQMDAVYAASLASYDRSLRSRNRLLKDEAPDRRSIAAFDELLAEHGAVIGKARARLLGDLAPRVQRAFEEIVGAELPLSVTYQPRVAPERDTLRAALAQALPKDLARGFTADGPHADDMALALKSVAARHHASQGQHRAMVLALKIAELDVLTERMGRVPVLLLDDVSSELDRSRNRRLFEVLARLGGQVFLTTTHPEFILLEQGREDFHVEKGRLTAAASNRAPAP
jgi:DNA replication and repair protein RecF